MTALLADETAPDLPTDGASASEERLRRCIVGGASLPRARMVRYAVREDDGNAAIVPDIAARLPGRGLWTEARRDIVATAVAKRAFARAAGRAVAVAPDLDRLVGELLARRVLDLVGMARRSHQAVAGFEPVCEMLAGGRAGVLLLAADAAPLARTRLTALAATAAVPLCAVLSADELGQLFGRPRAAQVAVRKGRLAHRLAAECARLAGFREVNVRVPSVGS